MTDQIAVEVTTSAGHTVVSASGEIDIASAPVLEAAIDASIGNGTRQLIVDLQNVSFLDSTALHLLVTVLKRLGPGSLGVVARRSNVRKIFALSGLDTLIPIFDTVDDAIDAKTLCR